MPNHFDIIRENDIYSARPDGGNKFAVGQRFRYRNKKTGEETIGLANDDSSLVKKFNYSAAVRTGEEIPVQHQFDGGPAVRVSAPVPPKGTTLLLVSCPISARPNQAIRARWHQ